MSDSPAMISAPRLCPKCGAEIPSDAPEGGCPGCLFEAGVGVHRDGSVTVPDSSAAAVAWANADAVADARHSKKAARAAETLGELGDYELLEVVGRGGQGVVFRARQKSLVASSLNRWWVFAGILCALAAFSSTVYRYYAIRCPQCRARLTGVITSPTNPFAAPNDIVCCPFCQVTFDAEVPSTQSA